MQTSLKPKLPNREDLQTEQRSWTYWGSNVSITG